jgi:hypothetical protein
VKLKITDILKPKSEEDILKGLTKLQSVDRFCAEFWFYFNKSDKSIDSVYSIVKKIDKIENCFVSISCEWNYERYTYEKYSFDIKSNTHYGVIIDMRGYIKNAEIHTRMTIIDGIIDNTELIIDR